MGLVAMRIGSLMRKRTYYNGFDREEDNTGYEYYLAYHQWNAFQGWLSNHSEACESFNQFEVSAMIDRDPILILL